MSDGAVGHSTNGHPGAQPSTGEAVELPPPPFASGPARAGLAAASAAPFDELNPPPNTVAALRRPLPPVPNMLREWRGPSPSVAAPRALDEDDLPLAATRTEPRPNGNGIHPAGTADSDDPGRPSPIAGAYLAPSASHSRALHGSGPARAYGTADPRREAPRAELTNRFAAFVAENDRSPGASAGTAPTGMTARPTATAEHAASVYGGTSLSPSGAFAPAGASGPASTEARQWYSSPGVAAAAPVAPAPARQLVTFRAPVDLAGWAVAAGGLLSAISFVLPWARNGVAGGGLDRSYFGQWGLANPAYLLLVVFALIALLLAIVPNRLPSPLVDVSIPFVLGGFLCGLGWSYATGPFGTGLGVDTMFGGAVLLVVGGALGLRPKRTGPQTAESATAP